MTYQEAKGLLPNANFIYTDVSDKQLSSITLQCYVSELNGERIVGTLEPIAKLNELKAGSLSFV